MLECVLGLAAKFALDVIAGGGRVNAKATRIPVLGVGTR
jgi:hypothetical protein